jgi:hypothetical protein
VKIEDVKPGQRYWVEFGICGAYAARALAVGEGKVVMRLETEDHMDGHIGPHTPDRVIAPAGEAEKPTPRPPRLWWQFWRAK